MIEVMFTLASYYREKQKLPILLVSLEMHHEYPLLTPANNAVYPPHAS